MPPRSLIEEHASAFAAELHAATRIAKAVAPIALRYHRTDLQVDRKAGNEPVTIADRMCSTFIVEELQRAFPGDTVVSEEVADTKERLQNSRVWYVDPIDGTKDFIRGAKTYCIMIGLAIDHEPKIGVVYQPNHESLIFAAEGSGAWSIAGGTTSRLRVSRMSDISHGRLLTTSVAQSSEVQNLIGIKGADKIGSIGMKMCALAAGASDIYVNPATNCSSWDTCAPQVILQEAGGKMTRLSGQPLCYDNANTMHHQEGLIATNGSLHDAVVAKFSSLSGGK